MAKSLARLPPVDNMLDVKWPNTRGFLEAPAAMIDTADSDEDWVLVLLFRTSPFYCNKSADIQCNAGKLLRSARLRRI
jgi:hypothetical protein